MAPLSFLVAILMVGTLQHAQGQTIDELILMSQQPEDAKKAVAMQSPDSDTVMVELDMVYKKDTWQEMQDSRVELEDDYDYDYDNETEEDTSSESEESSESSESEETEESEESEHDCRHDTRSTGTASETRSTGTASESESDSYDESHGHGHGHRGHHGHHHRGRGRGRGHGSRGRGHHSRGRHDYGHGRHGQNVYPRRHKRKAIRPLVYRWTNKEVPYFINSAFSSDERRQIVAAIEDYKTYTCLKFPEKGSRARNYVNIVPGSGCSSLVGMTGGAQSLTLGNGCRVKSVILHELGHALGFQHEQTRPDRNGFVSIRRRNIYSGMEYNFDRYDTTMVNDYNIPYDYLSIMHYGQYAFSVNGERTIVTKDSSYQSKIGKAQGLSFRDIKLANTMYQCNATCTQKRTCPQNGFQGKDCKCYCKGNPIKECDGTDDNTGTDEETTEEDDICFDYHPLCSAWAAVGHCTASRDFMTKYCQKSCDVCGDDDDTEESECKDDDEHCAYWARNNHCTSRAYRAYMETHCARSCLICGGNRALATTRAPAECKDRHFIRCKVRKLLGECHRNTSYMHRNCRKRCGYC